MKTDQIMAVKRRVVEITPALMSRISVEPEVRKPRQQALGDCQIPADYCLSEPRCRIQHSSYTLEFAAGN